MSIAKELVELETLLRNGTLSRVEFETAKRLVLSGKASGSLDPLEEIKIQNEIAQLDRQWTLERESYMVFNHEGPRYIPSKGGSVAGGIAVVLFGTFWTAMATYLTSFAPFSFAMLFPAFGILFIVVGAASTIASFNKAQQYSQAEANYHRRRQELIDTQR